jgi:hypothetical protein
MKIHLKNPNSSCEVYFEIPEKATENKDQI